MMRIDKVRTTYQKRIFLSGYLTAVVIQTLFQFSNPVKALPECSNALLKNYQVAVINCSGQSRRQPQCSTAMASATTLNGGASVYIIGDSITYGARSKYREALLEKGISAHINASGGRSWTWSGSSEATSEEGSNKSGKQAVIDDESVIKESDGIVIALGTNGGLAANPIEEIIDTIRPMLKANNVPIWWVNVVVARDTPPNPDNINAGTFNTALESLSSSKVYTVIDWLREVSPGATLNSNAVSDVHDYYPERDSLHPKSNGQDKLVSTVVASLSGRAPGPTGCGGTSGSENQKFVFDFFVSKGYTPEQAAGIVGNMIHESGVEPMRLQGTQPGVETPSEALGSNLTNSNIGWGLVQWTPPSKMVANSNEAGVDYATIDTPAFQVQFLYEQLEGTGLGGTSSNESSAGERLKATNTVEEAAISFAGYYERFRDSSRELPNGSRVLNLSNPEYQKRIDSAIDVLTRYGSE